MQPSAEDAGASATRGAGACCLERAVGVTRPAVTFGDGEYVFVLERFGAPVQPLELIGRNAAGKVVAHYDP